MKAWSDQPGNDVRIIGKVGTGRRCTVWRAKRGDRDVVVKHFTDAAVAKHAARHAAPLARFEYERNRTLVAAAGLRRNIAEPLGFVAEPRNLLVQEFIDGTPLSRFAASAGRAERDLICAELGRVVAAAHAVAVYDLDLHLRNVLVRRDPDGLPTVVLFDFNKIPYHEWPPNPVARWLVALGCIGPESRDRRGLRAIRRRLSEG